MLDAAVIARRCPGGLGAKLHHKHPIGWERRLRLGHSHPPCTATAARGIFELFFSLEEDTIRSPFKTTAKAFKFRVEVPTKRLKTVQKLFKRRHQQTPWNRNTPSPLGHFVWIPCMVVCGGEHR